MYIQRKRGLGRHKKQKTRKTKENNKNENKGDCNVPYKNPHKCRVVELSTN